MSQRATSFQQRVYALVRQIPPGRVTTYSAIATLIYTPRAARAVGQALKAGVWGGDEVPWQRVINSQGRISFRGDVARAVLQRALLEREGVCFDAAGRVELARYGWWGD
jgi:methylated-DNA-protein-cysteine methyltransferase related protein